MDQSIYSGEENHPSDPAPRFMASLARMFSPLMAPVPLPDGAASTPDYRIESAAFSHALVALAAKFAAIDGAANPAEYASFHAQFVAHASQDAARARSMFVQLAGDSSSALQYARQLAAMTPNDSAMHRDLLLRLINLGVADGPLNAAELELLRAVADAFGIAREQFRTLMARGFAGPDATPYEVLGISAKASDQELREHYRLRVQALHPDRFQASGASSETVALLSEQLAHVNAAYNALQQQRAKKSSRGLQGLWSRKHEKR